MLNCQQLTDYDSIVFLNKETLMTKSYIDESRMVIYTVTDPSTRVKSVQFTIYLHSRIRVFLSVFWKMN